jgi:hypothetical protein
MTAATVAIEAAVAGLAERIQNIKETLDAVDSKVDLLMQEGLIRRVALIENHQKDQDAERRELCQDMDALRAEVRGALRVLKWSVAVVTFLAVIVTLVNNSAALIRLIAGL